MTKRKTVLPIIAVLAIILAVLATLFVASATENFLFTENLTMSQPEHRSYGDGEAYVVNMTTGDTYVDNVYLSISGYQNPANNSATYYITLQVPYQTGIEKDAISFKIVSTQAMLYMETNQENLTPTFNRNDAEQTVTINNIGDYGQSTITYYFLLQTGSNIEQIPVDIELSAHQMQPLQLTSLKAHIAFDAQTPTSNT